jgi:hypothetical protein
MQVANLAPGLYYEPVQPVRADGLLTRGDVPLFIGFTRRGPVRQALRVHSLREVIALFGDPPDAGHLMPALRGFFETGGAAAYVMRLAIGDDPADGVAGFTFANGWRAWAAFNWRLIDPNTLAAGDAGSPAWAALVAAAIRDGASVPDPGTWGDRLQLAVSRASLPLAAADPLPASDGRRAFVPSLAGLEAGGIVELSQDAVTATVALAAVDAALLQVELAKPLGALGLSPRRPFQLTGVEFRVDVLLDGRSVERFDRVSLASGHSRALGKALATSHYVAVAAPELFDPADPAQMLPQGIVGFGGGRDRVLAAGEADMRDAWMDAIAAGARVDEPALIATPDLVLQPPDLAPQVATPARPLDCCDLEPAPPAFMSGSVVDSETGEPVAGVTVTVAGKAPQVTTGADGAFTLAPLPAGLFTVRLSKPGYEVAELLLQASEFGPAADPIELARLAFPTRLSDDGIVLVQQSMATGGRYKVAIVDPPAPNLRPDALLTWRARLGDSDRLAFFAPWIVTPDDVAVPPSGHVCGALAAAEIAAGIARAPANLPLRYATAPSLAIDDPTQAGLNTSGVNAIRAFSGRGLRIWGARTLSSDPAWRQLTARRVVDAIERTLEATLQWAVFEGNDVIIRQAVAFSVETLLSRLWRSGGLAGTSPAEAYRIKCDLDNNPDATVSARQLIVEIAVAPSVPFEWIVFRIAKSLDQLGVGG